MESAIRFSLLSSGSKANCAYVQSQESAVLVDCGLSFRELERRASSRSLELSRVQAIVVSHEHSDHVRGIEALWKKLRVPVFCNAKTLESSEELQSLPDSALVCFCTGEGFSIGDITVESFPVSHDAAEPVAFLLRARGTTLAVVTDLGFVSQSICDRLAHVDALVLECNHELELLAQAPYPRPVKERIRGDVGHLSNGAASALLSELCGKSDCWPHVIVAAHVSENSNRPERALQALERGWTCTRRVVEFAVASAHTPTKVFELSPRQYDMKECL